MRNSAVTLEEFNKTDCPADAVTYGHLVEGPVALFAADVSDDQGAFRSEGMMLFLLGTAPPSTLRNWFSALSEGGRVVDDLQARPWRASNAGNGASFNGEYRQVWRSARCGLTESVVGLTREGQGAVWVQVCLHAHWVVCGCGAQPDGETCAGWRVGPLWPLNAIMPSDPAKVFGGVATVGGMNMCVPTERVFGVFGRNGSGETTTTRNYFRIAGTASLAKFA